MPDTVSDDDPVMAYFRAQRTGDSVHDAALASRLDTANLDHDFVEFGTLAGMHADEWIVLGVFGLILVVICVVAVLATHLI